MNSVEKTEFLSDNSFIRDFLQELEIQESFTLEKIALLGPVIKRKLNEEELELFEIDSFNEEINISQRLKLNNIVYHSRQYNKVGKNKASYYVKYKINESEFFGELNYFIQIENFFYAALFPYQIISKNIFQSVKPPSYLNLMKREGFFDNVIYTCKKTDNLIIINSESIIGKCIIFENDDTNYLFCEYSNEKEHD